MAGPNGNLHVEPEELDAFAKASDSRADQFSELRNIFLDGHVPRHAFGVMPASFGLAAAYEQLFEECLQGLADGAQAMADIAEGMFDAAAAYSGTDEANTGLFGAPGSSPMGPTRAF